ncbi:hypothetical protein DFH11DRAFT_1729911 [Phellopilus nigrolimitatus]|nr:hypothetical protein DFH11DRAFT_1729911 [Phellopilus nigrolimitatus]
MKSNGNGNGKAFAISDVDDTEFETQGFETQDGDSDQLWDVLEILAENKKNRTFLLKWGGADEDGNPWPDSWVPREDVTDDLVAEWKAKQAAKRKENARKKKERMEWKPHGTTTATRASINSKASSSTGTTSTAKRLTRQSTAGRPHSVSTATTARSPTKKRKQPSRSEETDSSAEGDRRLRTHNTPRKKRKIGGYVPGSFVSQSSAQGKVKRRTEQEEEEEEEENYIKRPKSVSEAHPSDPLDSVNLAELAEPDPFNPQEESNDVRAKSTSPAVRRPEEDRVRTLNADSTLLDKESLKHAKPNLPAMQRDGEESAKRKKAGPLIAPGTKSVKKRKVKPSVGQALDIYDKPPTPPTPPRSTSPKSRRTSSETPVASSSKLLARERRSKVMEPTREPVKRGKPIPPDAREEEETEEEEDKSIVKPSLPSPHVPDEIHESEEFRTAAAADESEASSSKLRTRSAYENGASIPEQRRESENRNSVSLSKRRGRGLVSRMKGKGKLLDANSVETGADIRSSASKSKSRAPTTEPQDLDEIEVQRRRSLSIPAHHDQSPVGLVVSLPDIEEDDLQHDELEHNFSGGDGDEDRTTFADKDNDFDDQLPFSQANDVSEITSPAADAIASNVTDGEGAPSTVPVELQQTLDRPSDTQASAGTVIPATQSQSQSQSLSAESVQANSSLAEHGSSAPQPDISTSTAEPISSREAEPDSIQPASLSFQASGSSFGISANGKELKPIPTISPSKFRPFFPVLKPMLAVPPVLLERFLQEREEAKAPMSSIEDSPVKDFDMGDDADDVQVEDKHHADGSGLGDDDDDYDDIEEDSMPTSLRLRQRGLELHEKHREKQQQHTRQTVTPRLPLDTFLGGLIGKADKTRSRSRSEELSGHAMHEVCPPAVSITAEPSHTGLSLFLGHGTSHHGISNSEDVDDDALVRQFEEKYMDFDGNAGASNDVEEVLHVFNEGIQDDQHGDPVVRVVEEDTHEEANVESSLHEDQEEDDPFVIRKGDSRREPTATATTSEQDEEEPPYTPQRFRILGSPQKFDDNIAQSPMINTALALLNKKSEETSELKELLSQSNEDKNALQERVAELKALVDAQKTSQSLDSQPEDHPDNIELTALKESHEILLQERDGLLAEVSLLKIGREDAQKNAELFRDLYGQASSFTDGLRRENAELTDRVTLAESQLSKGLELIRAQGAAQVKQLSEELDKTQVLLHVFKEKDQRTDDEVRRRAAREAELQPVIDNLETDKKDLADEVSAVVRIRNELLVKNHDLEDELSKERMEKVEMSDKMRELQVELARFSARERGIKKTFYCDDDEDATSEPGEEEVFFCAWAGDGGKGRCGATLTSRQDLQDHLFLEGHL